MRFAVERVSNSSGNPQPIDGAVLETFPIDTPHVSDIERWTIEIETLEDLMEFIAYHGEIILHDYDYMDSGLPLIKIYDGYNE